MQPLLLTLTILVGPDGCTKDIECKGDRICSSEGRCADPEPPPSAEEPEPSPAVEHEPAVEQVSDVSEIPEPPPPRVESVHWYRQPTTLRYHPYVAGGSALITFGTLSVIAGTALHLVHVDRIAKASLADFEALARNSPKVHAGTGVLISCGVTWFVTGVVLTAITKEQRVSFNHGGVQFAL